MERRTVTAKESAERADSFIADALDISRTQAAKLIEDGMVTLEGKPIKKKDFVKAGDCFSVIIEDAKPLEIKAESIPLDIVYEDDCMLIVNKPKGMVVHPAPGNGNGTLVNALMAYCKDNLSGINGVLRPGILHRIDKDTSGLLMVAKNDLAHKALAEQIKEHTFTREYVAVVYGNIKNDSGTIDAPIGRNPKDRKKMAVTDKNSRNAVTHYEVIERFGAFTLVKFVLETGRTHQIRVHSAYIGHPVAGDPVYGPKKVITELGGQCLHAKKIGFIHPATKEYMEFESPLPLYFEKFIKKLRKQTNGNI